MSLTDYGSRKKRTVERKSRIRAAKGTVDALISKKCDRENKIPMMKDMGECADYGSRRMVNDTNRAELEGVANRQIELLSGGELQRFAIAMCAVQLVRIRCRR